MTLKRYHSQMTLYVGVVVEMSADIEENTYERLKESLYDLQVDETMDTIGKCYLNNCVRPMNTNSSFCIFVAEIYA